MNIIIKCLIISLSAILSIFIHEFTKALAAYSLGDKSIKNTGQLTLNPLKYLDPFGFLFMVFLGYGWSKPVQINNLYLKNKNKNILIIYILPIIMNIIFSIIFYNLIFLWPQFYSFAYFNLTLAIFNLIPIYPLCGEKILKYFLKPNYVMKYMQFESIIRILVILLILMGPLKFVLDIIVKYLEILIQLIVVFKG